MTQRETLKAIRALGLTASVRDGEYRIAYRHGTPLDVRRVHTTQRRCTEHGARNGRV